MINKISNYLQNIISEGENLRFYFYTRDKKLFKPEMRENFFGKLIKEQVEALINMVKGYNSIEEFDLDGNLDNEISYIDLNTEKIPDYDLLKQKLEDDDYENLSADMVDEFYEKVRAVVAVVNEKLILVKKFSYPKKLINNSYIRFKKYPLTEVEDEIFSIDNRVDVFEVKGKLYILSNYFFECMFSMEQEYHSKVNESKKLIDDSKLLENNEEFIDSCLCSKRNTKKLLKLIKKNNFTKVKSKIKEVEKVIEEYDLSITIKDSKIVYNEGDSVTQILDLVGDNYYISHILGEKRLAQKNKTVE